MSSRAGPLRPGPRRASALDLIKAAADERIPLFGVCLGHQAIGQAFGGKIIRAPKLMHGKVDAISHTGKGVFRNLPSPLQATRYHSLTIDPTTFPLRARSDRDVVRTMSSWACATRNCPSMACSSTPESIATEHGHDILRNFLEITGVKTRALA